MKRSPLDDHARRQAQHSPRILAALSRLRAEAIEYTEVSPGQYLVAGKFEYWPAAGNWHQLGGSQTGGGVAPLIKAVRTLP